MATNFPGSLDSYSTKAAGNTISESHINDPQDAIEAIQEKVGTGASGTIDQSASTNTALVGYGASSTGFTTISLDNTSLVTGTLPVGSVQAGGQVQVVNTQTGAVATGTTVLPNDDTIPQITEGDEYMTLAITPTSATNKLKIEIIGFFASSSSQNIGVALFQDTTANALAAGNVYDDTANKMCGIHFTYYMTSGTTSSTTFRVRAGNEASGTVTFNGASAGRKYGGVCSSSITISEIKV